MHPRYVADRPKKTLAEMPRMPGAAIVRYKVLVRPLDLQSDSWWFFADTHDEAMRYKQDVIEEHGQGYVSIQIVAENLSWRDNMLNRISYYSKIGENAADGKKKTRSVAGSAPKR